MKFKIDENLPKEVAALLIDAAFEADTVADEGLQGAGDEDLAAILRSEGRVIITLDTDFGNIAAYPPESYPGLIILRPTSQDKQTTLTLVRRLLKALKQRLPDHELWIVEPDRIRFRGRNQTSPPE